MKTTSFQRNLHHLHHERNRWISNCLFIKSTIFYKSQNPLELDFDFDFDFDEFLFVITWRWPMRWMDAELEAGFGSES